MNKCKKNIQITSLDAEWCGAENKLLQFPSKYLLTATTNHGANCIWIKGAIFLPIEMEEGGWAECYLQREYFILFSLPPHSEAPKLPNKKWVFHYQQIV